MRLIKDEKEAELSSAFLMAELEELLKKREKIEQKLAEIKLRLGHPHLDFIFEEIKLAESEA